MMPIKIGLWISVILWSSLSVMEKVASNDEVEFYLIMEFICLGFMWIFIGFNHGWW